jgi:hypothetical protein
MEKIQQQLALMQGTAHLAFMILQAMQESGVIMKTIIKGCVIF